jgi:hypothetical protein
MITVLTAMISSQVLAETFEVPERVRIKNVECVKRGSGNNNYGFDVYSNAGQYMGASPVKTKQECDRYAYRVNELLGRSTRVTIKVSENSPNVIEDIQQLRAPTTAAPLIVTNGGLACEYVKGVTKQTLRTGCEKPLVVSQLSCDDAGVKFTTLAACADNISANECYGVGSLMASKAETSKAGGTR